MKDFRCRIGQSGNLLIIVLVAHITAVIAVVLADLPAIMTIFLLAGLLLSSFCYWQSWRYVAEQKLYFHPDTGWCLNISGHGIKTVDLTTVFVSQWLIIMNYRSGRFSRRTLLLTRDNTDPDSLRQLRVLLLYG